MKTFNDILDKHNDHSIFIRPKSHKNRADPVWGLYCRDCVKLIKWLSDREAVSLVDHGVDVEEPLRNECQITEKSQFPINILVSEDMDMKPEYVKLTEKDLQVLIEISQMCVDYKFRALSRKNWQIFEEEYLPSLVSQLGENSFKVADPVNNTFTWIIDQISHSRRIVPGVNIREARPLADLPIGEEALMICRSASRGQVSYNTQRKINNFDDLFGAV